MASHRESRRQIVEKDFSPPERVFVWRPWPVLVSSGSTYDGQRLALEVVWKVWKSRRVAIQQDQVSFACDLRAAVRGSHDCLIDERRVFVLWPQYKL